MHDDLTLVFELTRYLRREQLVADDSAALMAALRLADELANVGHVDSRPDGWVATAQETDATADARRCRD